MKARRGVTLMELIVALTVTGFMAAMGTAAFTSIIDNRHLLRESTAETERASALRETLRQWLVPATVQFAQGGGPRGMRRGSQNTTLLNNRTQNGAVGVTAAAMSDDEISFTTTAPNPANAPSARMRLFVDTDESTPEKGLALEYQVSAQTPLRRVQLDSTVAAMTIEYLDSRTNRWIPSSESATARPKAMRITLTAMEGVATPALMQLPMTFYINNGSGGNSGNTPVR